MTQKNRNERRGLGRGLGSLLGTEEPGRLRSIAIDRIAPGRTQPRTRFDEAKLDELTESIRTHGILQPVLVRRSASAADGEAEFEIVAGERRWRAAQRAGLHEIPAIVEEMEDPQALAVALIENVQRTDLMPLEEADGYNQLITRYGHTQQALAALVGKSRSHIANTIRLLSLPEATREHVKSGRLTAGHARALLGAEDADTLAARVVKGGLSVRETEKLARTETTGAGAKKSRTRSARQRSDANLREVETSLSEALGARVRITQETPEKGTMAIQYTSLRQLDHLLDRLTSGAGYAPPVDTGTGRT